MAKKQQKTRKPAPARTVSGKTKGGGKPAKIDGKKMGVKSTVKPAAPSTLKSRHQPAEDAFAPALTDEQLRKVKTGLTKKDLEHYEQLLLEKRREILGDVASLETDRDSKNSSGNLSNMPLHMADVGTETYEQEFTLHLVESEQRLLREINEALLRLRNGTYGVCVESGKPINKARLDAKPWAKYCIEVARLKERFGQSF